MAELYVYYEAICHHHPGWSLTEVKHMPSRERKHWVALIQWRQERNAL